MATGNQATLNIQISWLEKGMTPGREVPPREDNSTRATLVRNYIRISWRELVYELISGEGMFQTLEVEEPLMRKKSTMATLVRKYIRFSGRELVYDLISGEGMLQTLEV
jgi:hypothetical protein